MKRLFGVTVLLAVYIAACTVAVPASEPVSAAGETGSVILESAEEKVIFRKSFEHKPPVVVREDKWNFMTTVLAYDTGHIQIKVSCVQSDVFDCNEIGKISFDDSLIQSVGEKSVYKVVETGVNVVTSFDNENVIYTVVYPNGKSSLGGKEFITFDFYATEAGMKTSPVISVMGEEIVIPFSEKMPEENLQEQIAALKSQAESLQAENQKLKSENYDLLHRKPDPDYNGDGLVTIGDAVWLLRFISEDPTLQVS
ncbi:MAG: hypothetical protein IJL32_11425 [Oscillospiraceae bacterium]|nr:hypothetical protein [Oscillospiraceae bacterium]